MTVRTQIKAGDCGRIVSNHNETLQVRSALKAGRSIILNHNEGLQVRSAVKGGGVSVNHNEALQVRSAVKAGGVNLNHNEALQVHSALKAGGWGANHNETLSRGSDRPAIAMLREPRTTSRKEERLELLVIRAGLRAGRLESRGSRK